VAGGDAGEPGARCVEVEREGDGFDESEVDDVDGLLEGILRVEAGAEGFADIKFGEHCYG
jgi:hypothetical protein